MALIDDLLQQGVPPSSFSQFLADPNYQPKGSQTLPAPPAPNDNINRFVPTNNLPKSFAASLQPVEQPSLPQLPDPYAGQRAAAQKLANTPTGLTHYLPTHQNPAFGTGADQSTSVSKLLDSNGQPAKNGFWQKLAKIGEGIGNVGLDIFAPGTAALIPGTQLNRQLQHQEGLGELSSLNQQQNKATTSAADLAKSNAAEQRAKTADEISGKGEWKETANGDLVNSLTGEVKPVGTPKAPTGENAPVAPEQVKSIEQQFLDRYKVLNPTATQLPPEFKLSSNPTQREVTLNDRNLQQLETATSEKARNDEARADRDQRLIDTHLRQADSANNQRESQTAKGITPVIVTDPNTHQESLMSLSDAEALKQKNPGYSIVKAETADVTKTNSARRWLPLITDPQNGVLSIIDDLDKKGALAPVLKNWNDFMTGSWGKGDANAAEYQALKTQLELSNTLLMNIHVGQRGGGALLERFDDLANARKLNSDSLKSSLKAETQYVKDQARLPFNQGGAGSPPNGSKIIKWNEVPK
jgi:hypothetical protein